MHVLVLLYLVIVLQCFTIVGCHLRSRPANTDYQRLAEGAAKAKFYELEGEISEGVKRDPSRKSEISFSDFHLNYTKLTYGTDTSGAKEVAHHYLWIYRGKLDLGERSEISVTVVPAEGDAVFAVFGNHWR